MCVKGRVGGGVWYACNDIYAVEELPILLIPHSIYFVIYSELGFSLTPDLLHCNIRNTFYNFPQI